MFVYELCACPHLSLQSLGWSEARCSAGEGDPWVTFDGLASSWVGTSWLGCCDCEAVGRRGAGPKGIVGPILGAPGGPSGWGRVEGGSGAMQGAVRSPPAQKGGLAGARQWGATSLPRTPAA